MRVEEKTQARQALRWLLTAALLWVIGFCGARIWDTTAQYRQEAALHRELLRYRPARIGDRPTQSAGVRSLFTDGEMDDGAGSAGTDAGTVWTEAINVSEAGAGNAQSEQKNNSYANQSILDLREINPDAVGWITIPGTEVDYPFVQAADNNHYLGRDLYGKYAAAGTIFLDYRNNPKFSNANTMLYGHHMRNGSMFGTLNRFDKQEFFDQHTGGAIYLDYNTFELEIFAYMVVTSGNAMIYDTHSMDTESQTAYFDYVKEHARRYRDIGLAPGDRIVTLSTCAYEFSNARMVVLARIRH